MPIALAHSPVMGMGVGVGGVEEGGGRREQVKEWDNEREVSLEGREGSDGKKRGNCRVAFHLQLFM